MYIVWDLMKEACIGLWIYNGPLRGWRGVESWLFSDLERERGTVFCHFVWSSESEIILMLLFINTLFTQSEDTVNSSLDIRRLLKFAYCVKSVVLECYTMGWRTEEQGLDSWQEQEYFSSPLHPDWLWGPSILSSGYQGLIPWEYSSLGMYLDHSSASSAWG
jgi:hypothetical protein